jgi:hypothetical protein
MPSNERDIVETERRSAGQAAHTADRDRVAARAEERSMLTQEELDRRQEAIGRRRRPAGPPLQNPPASSGRTAAEAADVPEDVPETECADPPDHG